MLTGSGAQRCPLTWHTAISVSRGEGSQLSAPHPYDQQGVRGAAPPPPTAVYVQRQPNKGRP
jgi:hypothetical protein